MPGLWDRTKELLAGERNHLRLEKAYYRPDGSEVWTDLVLSLIRDPDGSPALHGRDDGEHHRAAPAADAAAAPGRSTIPLTDLPNRTLFFERLDAALRPSTRPGVCYLDLDGFKAVNDTLGHDLGDRLLHAVARPAHRRRGQRRDTWSPAWAATSSSCWSTGSTRAKRGDERLRTVARSALEAVRRPIRLDDNEIVVSASIGVVRADGGHDAAELMKAADTTLYWAKADGRNRYALFDEDRHRSDVDRFELSARMPDALTRGEFSLEYQPLVRLADRSVLGVEALVRWTLPDGRRLDPGRFVPLAEDSGFIVPLGRWVLRAGLPERRGLGGHEPGRRSRS